MREAFKKRVGFNPVRICGAWGQVTAELDGRIRFQSGADLWGVGTEGMHEVQ